MKRLMKTRIHRYAPRMPTIRESNEANMNNYVDYANNFELEEEEYPNNFHNETEEEEYAVLKQIMAQPISAVDPLTPIPNGRITPAPVRPVAGASPGAIPGSFKPSIGSAFSAFKKKGGRRSKKLIQRRRHRRGTHKDVRRN